MPDIVTSKTFVDGEKGITAAKLNQIISGAVIQPAFYSAKPSTSTLDPTDVLLDLKGTGSFAQITGAQLASSVAGQLTLADATQNGMLRQVSGLTTDVVDGTNHCVPIASMSGITQMRMRSYNAIENSTFEVDQRTIGVGVTGTATGFAQDRWFKAGTLNYTAQQSGGNPIVVPGTNFAITKNILRIILGAQKTSLATTDLLWVFQYVEGPRFRELISDVHSVSLLVRSSVASVTFSVTIKDGANTYSLTNLCTTSATPNTWTLVTLPNLQIWSPSGSWSLTPGTYGYVLGVCLAAGSSLLSPTVGSWQGGNFTGAVGMGNFAANSVGATFDIAYIQHESGPICTAPNDSPFTQNLEACLRYYQKSTSYGSAALQAQTGLLGTLVLNTTAIRSNVSFKKLMAKTPTIRTCGITAYTGQNQVYLDANSSAVVVGSYNVLETGIQQIILSATGPSTGATSVIGAWDADTGW
jgi:hypothetical protein